MLKMGTLNLTFYYHYYLSRVNALLPEALPWIFNKMAIRSVAHPMREYGTNATITVAIIGDLYAHFFIKLYLIYLKSHHALIHTGKTFM